MTMEENGKLASPRCECESMLLIGVEFYPSSTSNFDPPHDDNNNILRCP